MKTRSPTLKRFEKTSMGATVAIVIVDDDNLREAENLPVGNWADIPVWFDASNDELGRRVANDVDQEEIAWAELVNRARRRWMDENPY